jgi:nucleolar GTP-binding protein
MKNFSRPDLQDTNFKYIQALPSGSEFIDIGLSKTQRKTPTVVKRGWPIQRIRQFYMRKIKFIRSDSHERLSKILDQFPKIDEIHPFYSDLLGLIYDKNNYKLALGRINSCRNLICKLARDHLKLLKFSDSIYRCKQLKRALFGRISKVKKKLSPSLTYLQKFRQHIALLPSIDPKKRTILLCGFPNVGKSSFMNKITRANVEVQKYPFTTKSLNLGHMEYKYQNWQIIDTPGILDRPLDERNTIEMKSITALAHLRACIVYILDVSEACGYTIKQQVALFESIKPLVSNRPLVIACNKIDCIRPEDIPSEDRNLIEKICSIDSSSIAQNNAQNIEIETPKLTYISTINGVGLMETKQIACDGLLNSRIELKLSNIENQGSANPLHITIPSHTKKINPSLPRSLEETIIDRGIYKHDNSQDRLLNSTKWQFKIPEIISGYNVFDFIYQACLNR